MTEQVEFVEAVDEALRMVQFECDYRQSSVRGSLGLAFLNFCGRHGFEKDGWMLESH